MLEERMQELRRSEKLTLSELERQFGLLLEGKLGLRIGGRIIKLLEAGDFFGSFLTLVEPEKVHLEALAPSRIYLFESLHDPQFQSLLAKTPGLVCGWIRTLLNRAEEIAREKDREMARLRKRNEKLEQQLLVPANIQLKLLREAVSGTIYMLEKEMEKYGRRGIELALKHLKAGSGIQKGRKADIDDQFYDKRRSTISGVQLPEE